MPPYGQWLGSLPFVWKVDNIPAITFSVSTASHSRPIARGTYPSAGNGYMGSLPVEHFG